MVPTMPLAACAPNEQSYWYVPGSVNVNEPMQTPAVFPETSGNEKVSGLDQAAPVVEDTPLTSCVPP